MIGKLLSKWTALAVALALAGCASRSHEPPWNPTPASARLVELVGDRLVLARDIAWAKFRAGLPVRDGRREKESLRAIEAQARGLGIEPGRARRFFRAQIAASRALQSHLIREWKQGGSPPPHPPRSLDGDLRPRMDQINAGMVVQLASAGSSARGPELARQAERYLLALGIPREAALKAVGPLR